MPYCKVGEENSGSIELFYEDQGKGQPVILIHGWPLNGRSWEKQTTALLTAGYRVIAYDRRGFGLSSKPAFGYDYDTFASDLNTLINKLDLREAILVGFSMGTGEVARYFGKYGSDRIAKAVFIASVPPFLLKTEDNGTGVDKSIFDKIQQAISKDRPAFLSKFLADFYNIDKLLEERVSDEVVQLSWTVGAMASPIGTLECVRAWLTDFREDIKKIDVPCMVIHGNEDRILPIGSTGEPLSKALKSSRYVVIAGAPHGLIWTHADQINSELLSFLRAGEKRRQPLAGQEVSQTLQ